MPRACRPNGMPMAVRLVASGPVGGRRATRRPECPSPRAGGLVVTAAAAATASSQSVGAGPRLPRTATHRPRTPDHEHPSTRKIKPHRGTLHAESGLGLTSTAARCATDLTAAQWNVLTDEGAARLAQEIADRFQMRLLALRWHQYAGRSHRVALFDRAGAVFALVPGGRSALGYDGARFRATPAQAADFAEAAEEYGLPDLVEYLDGMTSPARSVELPAMLVAVEALEPCASDLDVDDPRVRAAVAKAGGRRSGGIRTQGPNGGVEVRFGADGQVSRARTIAQVSYEDAIERVHQFDMRLSTPDEWEYACGAGADTLFRWGDDTPDDGYPYDHQRGPHRDGNLWGLAIGQDPYRHEWTSTPTIVCGGDGGGATCGGMGFFVGWVTLATAYRDQAFGAWLDSESRYVHELLVRPIVDLA